MEELGRNPARPVLRPRGFLKGARHVHCVRRRPVLLQSRGGRWGQGGPAGVAGMSFVEDTMTLLDQTRAGAGPQTGGEQSQGTEKNVGDSERAVSVAAGAIVALSGITRGTLPGLLMAGVGGMLIHRGVTG